jgi:hypothetical protein
LPPPVSISSRTGTSRRRSRAYGKPSRPRRTGRAGGAIKSVEAIETADENGVGAVAPVVWRTALPYTLELITRTTCVEPLREIDVKAQDELNGRGLWTFTPQGEATRLGYDRHVDVEKPWMRLCAPVLRPVFVWNHDVVMRWGEQGLREWVRRG